jgi:integrase/recombinase XerD
MIGTVSNICSIIERSAMLVQRVVMPVSDTESWTLLDDTGVVVEPVEQYLAYLTVIERSPNTVRAYAISLQLWFEFLSRAGLDWRQVGVEDVARFVGWLRSPAENVIVHADMSAVREAATVNRYLAGVFGFYEHHARAGVAVAEQLVAWRRISRGAFKPLLHHVTKGRPIPTRPVRLPVPRRRNRPMQQCPLANAASASALAMSVSAVTAWCRSRRRNWPPLATSSKMA